jgi:threonyl-tRNA synthetase
LPLFLAPLQARILPVGTTHRDPAAKLRDRLAGEGFRADVDDRDETLGKRIREAELEKVPDVVVWGDRESDEALAVRRHGGEQISLSLEALLDELRAAAKL